MLMSGGGPSWQSVAAVLSCYGGDVAAASLAYRRFMADGIGRTDPQFDGAGFVRRGNRWQVVADLRRAREAWVSAERVLAGSDALRSLEPALPTLPPLRPSQALAVDPSVLVERVTRQLGVTVDALAGASRHRSVTAVRALLAHLLVRRCGLSSNQTARALGVSKWSVSRALQRTEAGREPPAVAALLAELERTMSSACG